MRRVDVQSRDGLNLSAYEGGNPQGPEILFLHGFSQCSLCWRRQFSDPTLAAEFRLVAFDLRGHGASEKPLERERYASNDVHAADIHSIMEALHLRHPVAVAWSYGGRVIQDYIRTFGTVRLAGINFVAARTKTDPAFDGPGTNHIDAMLGDDLAANIAATRSFLAACFAASPTRDEFETALAYNMLVPAPVRAAHLRREPNPGDLPVLVTQGSEDLLVLKGLAELTAAAVPGARLSIDEGIGHSPFSEDCPRFNRELAEFARACAAVPRSS
jgi:pimeloyl-ACP methyl ester carboxylesterase